MMARPIRPPAGRIVEWPSSLERITAMSQAQADEFAALDATAQAELVRRKEVKPIELVEAAIKRIERINPALNAVITPMYDQAREAANGELPDGPFTGVPFLLKD